MATTHKATFSARLPLDAPVKTPRARTLALRAIQILTAFLLTSATLASANSSLPAAAANLAFPSGWTNPTSPATYEDWGFGSCNPPYNAGKAHLGSDSQGTRAGQAVVAISAGTVVNVVASNWGPGGAVGIEHTANDGTRFLAVYGHVNVGVSNGARVAAGQQVAVLYNWGTNSHLHLSIRPLGAGEDASTIMMRGTSVCTSTAPAQTYGFVNPIPFLAARSGTVANGQMWQVVKEAGQPWQRFDVSTGVRFQGTPTVLWGSTVNVFGVATDGRLVQLSIVPGQTGWRAFDLFGPGSFTGGVDAVQVGSSFQIFGVDSAGRMWQVVKDPGQPWQRFDISSGTRFQGTPTVLWGSTINVFGVATDGRLVQLSIVPGQTGWRGYELFPPGSFTGGVDAVQAGSSFQIFGVDGAGRMWQVVKDPGQPWQRFEISAGTQFKGTPSVLWGSTVNVFGVATDGRLVQLSIVLGQTGWRGYELFPPGSFFLGVDAVQIGSTFQVFGV